MLRELKVSVESWPLLVPFRISRGVKTAAEVVVVEIVEAGVRARGEAVPYSRYGETTRTVVETIQRMAGAIAAGASRADLEELMPPGAARCAVDCALWDLSARISGVSVTAQLGQPSLPPLQSALTISLDTPQAMSEAAAKLDDGGLIKIKVDASQPEAQVRAVREVLPEARLIVDPNESWNLELLKSLAPTLQALRVDLLEQPLPADADEGLEGLNLPVPVCADESCHVSEDLPRLRRRYQAVNIKLEKTGGLTEALKLLESAQAAGFTIMSGCMVSTSLDIVPAFHIARHAAFVDLDGPILLAQDRPGGVSFKDGQLLPPQAGFWGENA